MGNMLRGGLKDAEAEGNLSGWEDTEVAGQRDIGIQDIDRGPPTLAVPSLTVWPILHRTMTELC